jgi:hypothetical protein
MKSYEVWFWHIEEGNYGVTCFIGNFEAESWQSACEQALIYKDYDLSKYDAQNNTYPGLMFYSNETNE